MEILSRTGLQRPAKALQRKCQHLDIREHFQGYKDKSNANGKVGNKPAKQGKG